MQALKMFVYCEHEKTTHNLRGQEREDNIIMGSNYIEGFKDLVQDIDTLLQIQLQGNHYPPVSLDFIPACKEAISAGNDLDYGRQITMCNGKTMTAGAIIEGLHLETFLIEEEY